MRLFCRDDQDQDFSRPMPRFSFFSTGYLKNATNTLLFCPQDASRRKPWFWGTHHWCIKVSIHFIMSLFSMLQITTLHGQCKVWKFEPRPAPVSMAAQPWLDNMRTPRTNHHVVEAVPICVHSRRWQHGLTVMSNPNIHFTLYDYMIISAFSMYDTCISVFILYFRLRACLIVVCNVELLFASNLVVAVLLVQTVIHANHSVLAGACPRPKL